MEVEQKARDKTTRHPAHYSETQHLDYFQTGVDNLSSEASKVQQNTWGLKVRNF